MGKIWGMTKTVSLALAWIAFSWTVAPSLAGAAELRFFRNIDPIGNAGGAQVAAWLRHEFPFSTPIEKTDVVIVGSKVTIDAEVATNGGNILIVADELILNAPIDTRTRAYAHPPFWQDNGNWSLQTQFGTGAPQAMTPFFDWYYWYDVYNPATHKYGYGTGKRADYDKGVLLVPMKPPGRVVEGTFVLPPWDGVPSNAIDVDTHDDTAFQSGNITIYARSIQFCPDCRRMSAVEERAPGGNEFDINRTQFLNASGLPGGRGYLGSPFPRCIHLVQGGMYGIDCGSHGVGDRLGGLSGISQEGSTSGEISITIVNNAAYADQQISKQKQLSGCIDSGCPGVDFGSQFGQSLAALSNVQNGGLAYPGRVLTPSYNSLVAPAAGRAIFTSQATPSQIAEYRESWTNSHLPGGWLTIRKMSPSEALGLVALDLSNFDNNPAYDFKKTIEWMVNGNDKDAYTTPYARDLLIPFLMDLLEQRETQLLEFTSKSAIRSEPSLAYRPDFLSGFTHGQVVGLVRRETEVLERIGLHETDAGVDPLRSYFTKAGGLLKSSEHTTFTEIDLHLGSIVASLTRVRQEIDRLRMDIKDITTIQQKQLTLQKRQDIDASLAKVQASLDAALLKMKDAETAATEDIMARSSHLGQKLQGAFKELTAAIASEDYLMAVPAIYEIGTDMVKFYSEQDGLNDASLSSQDAVIVVQNQMSSLKESYAEFLESSRNAEDTIFSQRIEIGRAVLQATHDLQDQQLHVLVEFEDMLRASLIAYVADRSTSLGQLPGQLTLIGGLVKDFQLTPMYNLPNLGSLECPAGVKPRFDQLPRGQPIGCTFFIQTEKTAVLLSASTERLPDFPVVIVYAGSGSYAVPMKEIYQPASLDWAGPGAH